MRLLRICCLLLSALVVSHPATPEERHAKYGFATPTYTIEMEVVSYPPYLGRRLSFSNSLERSSERCHSRDGNQSATCIEHFVGAVAVVHYRLRRADGGTPG